MQNILDALGTLDVRGIAKVGPSIGIENLSAPPNVELHGFVPHAELLPTVSMLIGHGGHATTMAALAHDLPVLVMPMHPMLDQKMVGQSLVNAGSGRLVSKTSKPALIATTVDELMSKGPHRVAAARLGTAIRTTSGACAGADLVESLTRTGPSLGNQAILESEVSCKSGSWGLRVRDWLEVSWGGALAVSPEGSYGDAVRRVVRVIEGELWIRSRSGMS